MLIRGMWGLDLCRVKLGFVAPALPQLLVRMSLCESVPTLLIVQVVIF